MISEVYADLPDGKVITAEDRAVMNKVHASPMFGEITDAGLVALMSKDRLDGGRARVLYDLGSGRGRAAMHAFLTFPKLVHVVGIELSDTRAAISETAITKLHNLFCAKFGPNATHFETVDNTLGKVSCLTTINERVLEFAHGNILDVRGEHLARADIILLQTNIPQECRGGVKALLEYACLGCRLLTYNDMHEFVDEKCWQLRKDGRPMIPTTWSAKGHSFYLYIKV